MLRWIVGNYLRQTAAKTAFNAANQYANHTQEDGDQAEPDPAAEPLPPAHIGFVFALGLESGGFVDQIQNSVRTKCHTFVETSGQVHSQQVVAIETGEGWSSTEKAVNDFFTMHRPQWVVSCGFAEALQPQLRKGDFVMADSVAADGLDALSTGLQLDPAVAATTPRLHLGQLLTVKDKTRTPQQRTELAEQTGAIACDQESMPIAQLCAQHGTRFLAVRVITDARDDCPPPEVMGYLQQNTLAGKMGAAAGTLFRKPSAMKTMFQLRHSAMRASDRLAKFLVSMVPQLGS